MPAMRPGSGLALAEEAGRAPMRFLRARWGAALADDPFYSPLLCLDAFPYSGLAWPRRDCSPRLPARPLAVDVPLTM